MAQFLENPNTQETKINFHCNFNEFDNFTDEIIQQDLSMQSKIFLFHHFKQKLVNATKKLDFQFQQKQGKQNFQKIPRKLGQVGKKWQLEKQNLIVSFDYVVQQQYSQQPTDQQKNEQKIKASSFQLQMSKKKNRKNQRAFSSDSGAFKYMQVDQKNFIKTKHTNIRYFYQFIQLIGEGAFGSVYKAKCLASKQYRAIKILKSIPLRQKKYQKKFLAELQILKMLDHSNIIKIYEVYYFQTFYYVVTQYCSGGSIADYFIKQKNRLPHQIIKKIMKQLLSALNYLHDQRIVHRDLKLENIVFESKITEQTSLQQIQIKIIDFGLSTKLKFFSYNKDLKCIGSPKYLAPQTKRGLYSDKCDIWSSGIIFYYLLTGNFLTSQTFNPQTMTYETIQQQVNFKKPFWASVNSQAKLLLQKMLNRQDLNRISAKQALKSLWFQSQMTSGKTQRELVLKKISDYERQNNLICLIESYLIYLKANKQQRLKASKIFNKIDKDQNGKIDKAQLIQFFPDFKFDQDRNLKELIQKIDKNHSGKIQLSEFMACLYDRQMLFTQQYLKQAFDYLDRNQDGYIGRNQLQKALEGCDLKQFQLIMEEIDTNKDDRISKQQFINYMMVFFNSPLD